jgi:hypothetical protein
MPNDDAGRRMTENQSDARPPGPTQWRGGRILVRGILVALVVMVVPRLMRGNFAPPDMDLVTAELDRDTGRLGRAIGEYAAFIKSNPSDPRGYAGRGEAYQAIKFLQAAATARCAAAPSWAGFAKAELARINS